MIGIYGGTFDPIHIGHLRTGLDLLETLPLSELRFLPSAQPPHRDAPTARAEQRLAMVELAIAGHAGFVSDDRELRRDGPSYMVDTLTSLRADIGPDAPLCLIVGADAYAGLAGWARWQALLDDAHLVVMTRPDSPAAPNVVNAWTTPHRASKLAELHATPAGRVWFQTVTALTISASDLRERIAAGRDTRHLLPETVADFIAEHHLYQH